MGAMPGIQIRSSAAADTDAARRHLVAVVHATHDFLTEDDIVSLLPLVREFARSGLETWMLCSDEGTPMGFLGLSGSKIEALFLAPEYNVGDTAGVSCGMPGSSRAS